MTFEDSQRYCEATDSTLASFSSEQEFKTVQGKLCISLILPCYAVYDGFFFME